jgi:predicted DNA-binding transcriptional regulator AlpA
MQNLDDLITPRELCKWLGFSLAWLYAQRRKGNPNPIPCITIGNRLRFSRAAVTAWLQKRAA